MIKWITPTPGSDNPYLDSRSENLILLITQCNICKWDQEHSCRKIKNKAKYANSNRMTKFELIKLFCKYTDRKLTSGTNRAAAKRPIPGLEQPPKRFVWIRLSDVVGEAVPDASGLKAKALNSVPGCVHLRDSNLVFPPGIISWGFER